MTYITPKDVRDQFQGITFSKDQADVTLTADSSASVYIMTDPEGEYAGTSGNGITVEIVNQETSGDLSIVFNVDVITIELGGATHPAEDIAAKVNNLSDFVGLVKSSGDFTTADTMSSDLSGGRDDAEIEDAIAEASRIVEQYKIMKYGYTTDGSDSNELIDFSRDFVGEKIETDAKLWKINEYGDKELLDSKPCEGDITNVETYILHFDSVYSDFNFEADNKYMVEDTARRAQAELYKACSLLFANLQSSAEIASGVESVRVGEIEVEYGDIEQVANAISQNHFEDKFSVTVGAF